MAYRQCPAMCHNHPKGMDGYARCDEPAGHFGYHENRTFGVQWVDEEPNAWSHYPADFFQRGPVVSIPVGSA